MTSREQKIWDTVHAWAKHQNPGIPDDNLRGLMDDVLGVVESEVGSELEEYALYVFGVFADEMRAYQHNPEQMEPLERILEILFPEED